MPRKKTEPFRRDRRSRVPFSRFGPAVAGAAAFLLLLAVYAPALDGGFVWDDDFYVSNNQALRNLDGLRRIWTNPTTTPQYYPMTHSTFWVQYQIWGLRTLPYHVLNVLLHALSSLLLWRILTRLQVPGAWLGAALFALHPVQVESVAWITERKNVLAAFFFLASAAVYLRHFLRDGTGRAETKWPWRPALATWGLFAAALLSKTVTATLPVALAMVVLWKRKKILRSDLYTLVPMLAAGAVFGRVTAVLERVQVGAFGEEWSFTLAERALIAGRVFWFYLGKLAWPRNLTFVYPRWEIDAGDALAYLFPVAAVAAVAAAAMAVRRVGAGPLVAVAFFALNLAPASGFFDVFPMRYSFVADHFQYLASIGPLALAAAAATTGFRRFAGPTPQAALRPAGWALAAIPLVVLAVLTHQQARAWTDLETLWLHTIERNPRAWMAQYNLGVLLEERGDLAGAERRYRLAIDAKPDLAEAHLNLGNLLADRGDARDALSHYEIVVREDPDNEMAHYNLAVTLQETGDVEGAIRHYVEAVRLQPDFGAAYGNLAILLYRQGRLEEAVRAVGLARRYGVEPHPDFLRELARARERAGAPSP